MEPTSDVRTGGSALTDNAWGRIVGALVSAVQTFESIRRKPTWVAPLVVLVALNLATTLIVWPKVDFEAAVRAQIEKQQGGGEVDDEAVAQAAAMQEKIGLPCAVLAMPLGLVVFAVVFMVAFKLLDGEIGFEHSLSTTLYAMMPWVVATLLTVPVVLAQTEIDPEAMQKGGLLASHLGVLLPEDASPLLFAVLGSVDLFSIWAIALLVVGYSIVAGVSRGAAAGTVIGLWLVYVLLKVALAWVGTMAGGG